MNPIYKFTITVENAERQVYPNYKEDVSKDYELESQQEFFRAKVSAKFTFQKNDFEYLDSQDFETQFIFKIYKSNDKGKTWAEYWTGKFMKTDCEWNNDDKTAIVSPDTLDQYNDVLSGLDKEYNLIKLAPEKTAIQVQKRPLIQVYVPGDSVVSCFLSGNYWEQDTALEVSNTNSLETNYFFSLASTLHRLNVSGSGLPEDVKGDYVAEGKITLQNPLTFRGRNNKYRAEYVPSPPSPSGYFFHLKIYRESDNVEMFSYEGSRSSLSLPLNIDLNMTAVSGGASGTVIAYWKEIPVYMRYLLDVDVFDGQPTSKIPIDDIVENNRNYKNVIGYAIDQITITTNTSTQPTEYGIMEDDKYFAEPKSFPTVYKYFPVARSTWGLSSLWFNFELFDFIIEKKGRKTYMLKDCMLISDVIKVLLNEIAPNILHDGTSEYSQFLYGINPITFKEFRALITQKSNVLAGEYDRPAQKAPITLGQVFNMLRDCFKCFWYIDGNKLKIEHIRFFRNGGSYSQAPVIGIDLTQYQNLRNKKTWDFNSASYRFDKIDMPERYQFEWMDDVTESFTGFPIEILSKYVQEGKIDTISVSNFTTDIDYMLLNPNAISQDGFALMAGVYDSLFNFRPFGDSYVQGTYGTDGVTFEASSSFWTTDFLKVIPGSRYERKNIQVSNFVYAYDKDKNPVTLSNGLKYWQSAFESTQIPENVEYIRVVFSPSNASDVKIVSTILNLPFVSQTIDNYDLILQNGYLSWIYLHENYYRDDLPAKRVKINNKNSSINRLQLKKKQTVEFPTYEDIDPFKLIKTSLGNGLIDKISVNLHSRMNKVTLKYDTE